MVIINLSVKDCTSVWTWDSPSVRSVHLSFFLLSGRHWVYQLCEKMTRNLKIISSLFEVQQSVERRVTFFIQKFGIWPTGDHWVKKHSIVSLVSSFVSSGIRRGNNEVSSSRVVETSNSPCWVLHLNLTLSVLSLSASFSKL